MRAVSAAAAAARHLAGVSLQALVIFAIIAALLLALSPIYKPAEFLAGTSTVEAAKPGSAASLTCRATPDPVSVGGIYTISGSGYPTGKQLVIEVTDDHGTLVLFTGAKSDGSISASAYASWSGDHSVRIKDNSRRKPAVIGTCAFSVD